MKELSVEEKAKRYDSMFERLKEMYNNNKTNVAARLICERYFPELKESENKRMIQYFKDLTPFDNADELYKKYGFSHKDAIAWLEKQGEQIDIVNKEYWRGYREGKKEILDKYAELEKQGQVKESLISQHENIMCKENDDSLTSEDDKIRKAVIGAVETLSDSPLKVKMLAWLEKQGEQKPAWSEKYIADVFEKVGLAKIAREQSNDNLTNALQDAMIELSKFIPQPNPAWSEEDEEIHRKCICAMRASACGFPEEEKFVEQVDNWFKCLKERYTWKPSDEQVEALEKECIAHSNYELCRLLEQLKKLKG